MRRVAVDHSVRACDALAAEMREHAGGCTRQYKDDVYGLSGRRCLAVVELFYEPATTIFHTKAKVWCARDSSSR